MGLLHCGLIMSLHLPFAAIFRLLVLPLDTPQDPSIVAGKNLVVVGAPSDNAVADALVRLQLKETPHQSVMHPS